MANRSYLYSTNFVPGTDSPTAEKRIIGLAEWSGDIPLVHKIMVSVNPRKCRSTIWQIPDEIAILGDYEPGVAKLLGFLDQITHPAVVPLREQARAFLTTGSNRNSYALLEGGEIYDLMPKPIAKQADAILEEVRNVDQHMAAMLSNFRNPPSLPGPPKGFFSKLLGKKPPEGPKVNLDGLVSELGLGGWSNALYYAPKVS